ncbi:MAG TPA: zinc ribbon domain-containing protein [Gemmatimonadaceae bacterium]|nr:zinc ribbon domain-containing protein [Gemmatimonadaceae bacterium]
MDDLDRVFQRLVQNIRSRSPDQLGLPFTVAELYEQLIPYRHNRRELGIETNQDYESAVMRLLSGERGYIVGDDAMQDSLKKEIASQNPDTGAFREFGTTQISIAPDALEKQASRMRTPAAQRPAAPPPPPGVAATAAISDTATLDKRVQGDSPPPASRPAKPPALVGVAGVASGSELNAPQGCRYCSGTLPEGKSVTFCPHCGQNLSLNQCPACGAEMERGWKYCIGCGRPNA